MTDPNRFDNDPDALAWAREKIQHDIDRLSRFHREATAAGKPEQGEMWRRMANHMKRTFIGGEGCTIAYFDERRPAMARAVDHAIPPGIDRAIRRDHSLCGVDPCSDCR
ncbi:hypothetical protein OG432_24600 [Streptomyces sp. NBC_00442]|uniref:hypothetical protein n=1 Tax=Streptomyces sp. NBC_00442 TaxID=2903651 RepID=UPI002E22772E